MSASADQAFQCQAVLALTLHAWVHFLLLQSHGGSLHVSAAARMAVQMERLTSPRWR